MLVEPVELIQHRGTGLFQGGDGTEQIPQTFKVVFHLPAASHDISPAGVKNTVAGPAGNVHGLQNVDVGAGHLTVSYKEARCCERSQSAAYQICIFVVNAFRFFGTGECFVVTVGVVNALAVFLIFAALCIAVTIVDC